jgi:hypothetical protein
VVVVLPAWLTARVVVVGTLVAAHLLVARVRPHNPAAAMRVHQGLLGWDGGWYQSIAVHGYAASGPQSLRFFPLYPMVSRVVGWIPGVGPSAGLVVVSNLCSLAGMAVLYLLVRRDMDAGLARRCVWLLALAPSAYTLAWGYAEGPLLLCTTLALYAARTRRWWWAAAAGLAAGAVRPLGVVVLVPVVIEVLRGGRPGVDRTTVAKVAAMVAPLAGLGAFLAWTAASFGDGLLPFRVETEHQLHGPIRSPLASMWHNLVSLAHGHHLGSALHIPWVLLALVLVVVAFRRLPVSYGAFALGVVVVAASSANLDSFERYALSGFPLVIAASTLTSRRGVERLVLVVAALGMIGYSLAALMNITVP